MKYVSLCVTRRQSLMQPTKLIGNDSVDEIVFDAGDHSTNNGGIDQCSNLDVFTNEFRQLLLNHFLAGSIQRNRCRYVGDNNSLFFE